MFRLIVLSLCIVAALAVPFKVKRDDEECISKNQDCRGTVTNPCCGTMVCYWEDGYTIFKPGKCVTCVEEGKTCQTDSQCCGDRFCEKGNVGHIDGECRSKRPSGSYCYQDDHCKSGNCDKGWNPFKGTCV